MGDAVASWEETQQRMMGVGVQDEARTVTLCAGWSGCEGVWQDPSQDGWTVLHLVACRGQARVLRHLLEVLPQWVKRCANTYGFTDQCPLYLALREGHQECVDILLPLTEEPWRSGLDIFSSPSYWHDFYGATHSGDAVTVQGKRGYEWYGSHQDVQETLQEVCKSLPIDAGALCIQLGSGSSTLAEDMMQHWWQGLVVDTDLVVEALRKLNPRMHGSEAVACRFQDQVFRTGCADLVLDKGGLDALITSESWDSPLMEMVIRNVERLLCPVGGLYVLFTGQEWEPTVQGIHHVSTSLKLLAHSTVRGGVSPATPTGILFHCLVFGQPSSPLE